MINIQKSLLRDVGVDLSCRKIAMAEQLLDAAEVGPGIQHMSSVAVPQLVRGQPRVETGGGQVFLES